MKILLFTIFALLAFAANSLLCRLALGSLAIDPASFTAIRITSGAVMLIIVGAMSSRKIPLRRRGTWLLALLLFLYAVSFSFAYVGLSVGTGALILFGSVQATMILTAVRTGERPHAWEWIGLAVALAGLVYLVFPGLSAPPPMRSALMAIAGISWGIYSIRGRGDAEPFVDTARSFLWSVPLALLVCIASIRSVTLSSTGILLALVSGALTSGLGYVAWYAALKGLTSTRAAIVQLAVPALAAVAGVIFLSEEITVRLVLSAVMILGGVSLALKGGASAANSTGGSS